MTITTYRVGLLGAGWCTAAACRWSVGDWRGFGTTGATGATGASEVVQRSLAATGTDEAETWTWGVWLCVLKSVPPGGNVPREELARDRVPVVQSVGNACHGGTTILVVSM